MIRVALAFSGLLLCLALLGSPNLAFGQLDYEDNRVQLQLVPGESIDDINLDYGTTSTDEAGSLHLVEVGGGDTVWQIIDEMEQDPRIVWAELSYLNRTPEALRAMVVGVVGGTVQDYEDQEVYGRLHLDELHEYATGAGVTIAVLDTGVNGDHPALLGHVLPGYDFVDDDEDPSDTANGVDDDLDAFVDEGAGHGTMVAGIAHLAAPDASILPIRVIDDEGTGRTFDVVKGIQYAIDHGARVLNLSLGLDIPCEALRHGVDLAIDAGLIIVAAGGNSSGENPPFFPASLEGVHGVAALDSIDVKAAFSSYHPTISVSAPGAGIRGPFLDDGWAIGEGTSFAAPFISGQAAIIAEVRPALSKVQADAIVRDGVVDVYQIPGNGPYYGKLGSGRVDGIETWKSLLLVSDTDSEPGDKSVVDLGPRIIATPNPSLTSIDVVLSLRKVSPSGTDVQTAPVFTLVDVMGRTLLTLPTEPTGDGTWKATWNGRDSAGRELPSGFYLVRGAEDAAPGRIVRLKR